MASSQQHKFGMCSMCGRGLDDRSEFVVDSSPVKCVLLCNECWNEYSTYCKNLKEVASDDKFDREKAAVADLSKENAALRKRVQELEAQLSSTDLEYLQNQKKIIESSTVPFDENDERIVNRDGKRFRQWCSNGLGGQRWYGEKEINM